MEKQVEVWGVQSDGTKFEFQFVTKRVVKKRLLYGELVKRGIDPPTMKDFGARVKRFK